MANESLVAEAANGNANSPDDFEAATHFFFLLTGIEIPANFECIVVTTLVTPNEQTPLGLDRVRLWYRRNRSRLYWNEENQRIEIRKPNDPAERLWWQYEQELIGMIADRHPDPEDVKRARKAFRDLTGIEIPMVDHPAMGLTSTTGTQEALQAIRDWHERHRGRFFVANSGTLSVRVGR